MSASREPSGKTNTMVGVFLADIDFWGNVVSCPPAQIPHKRKGKLERGGAINNKAGLGGAASVVT